MPLRNPEPTLWHWQQAIAWIGFDIRNPPLGFNIYTRLSGGGTKRHSEQPAAGKMRATQALDELLHAVKEAAIKPIWRSTDYTLKIGWPEARERMLPSLLSSTSFDSSIFRNLYFERDDIIRHWPTEEPQVSSIRAEKGFEHWLREQGAEQLRRQGKKYWREQAKQKCPDLSQRGFDRAWTNTAKIPGYEQISQSGRKSQQ